MKRDAKGNATRYKARLVIKGCVQRKIRKIDYDETYSPLLRYTSVRFLLAVAVRYDLDIDQMDAVTAFLQGDLSEEIYMQQPEGFSNGSNEVCRLKKTLYGLKQASRIWNDKLNLALIEFGLVRSNVDPCIYYHFGKDAMFFVAVYVDDILIFTNDKLSKKLLKIDLMKKFKMKAIGEVSSIFGMNVERDRQNGILTIDQTHNCNPVSSPITIKNYQQICVP